MEDEPELVVADIHGYRSWILGPDGLLQSLFAGQGQPWMPGEVKEAFCDTDYRNTWTFLEPSKHPAPSEAPVREPSPQPAQEPVPA